MKNIEKIRVGVLRGGPSGEYDVSLRSGHFVLAHAPEHFEVYDIFIDKNGRWYYRGVAMSPETILASLDVVFNALHGGFGENGQIQRILEQYGVPYVGSSAVSSAVAMNKRLSKEHFKKVGLNTPEHVTIHKDSLDDITLEDLGELTFPVIVKPTNSGSSLGVSMVRSKEEIPAALKLAFDESDSIMIEEYVAGREATCGVIEDFRGEDYYTTMPIEIRVPGTCASTVHSYDHKAEGTAAKITPAPFTDKQKETIRKMAKKAHKALGLDHYSRADFIVTDDDVYILEVNTQPGLSEHCPFPHSLESLGIPYSEFIQHLVGLALRGKK